MEPQALGRGWLVFEGTARLASRGSGAASRGWELAGQTVLWAGCPHPGSPHSGLVESYLSDWPHALVLQTASDLPWPMGPWEEITGMMAQARDLGVADGGVAWPVTPTLDFRRLGTCC